MTVRITAVEGNLAADEAHALVGQYLESCRTRSAGRPEPAELFQLGPDEKARLIVDLVRARRTGAFDGPAYLDVAHIEDCLLATMRSMDEATPCLLLREIGATGGRLCGYPWEAAWKLARRSMASHGMTPALHDALRAMQPAMNVHGSDKNARIAIDRALWFAAHCELNPREDAADIIRADLRAMPHVESKGWVKLLEHGQSASRGEPNEPWLRKAEPLIAKVGREQLRARWTAWASAIAALDTPQFSIGGAETLRGLVWYGTLVRDESLDDAVRRLAKHDWRRGKSWRPQHDRFIAALAYALGMQPAELAAPIVLPWRTKFGRTTARYAIDNALVRLGVAVGAPPAQA